MTTKEQNQAVLDDLDSLLDKNLSDVEDLPEWLDRVPTGFYKLKITTERKSVDVKVEGKTDKVPTPVVQFNFNIVEVLELADENETPPKAGGNFGISFFFPKADAERCDKSAAGIKAMLKEVSTLLNIATVSDLVKKANDMTVGANVKCVKDKKDDERFYFRVSNATPM